MVGAYDELMSKHEELFKYLVYENTLMRNKSVESGPESTQLQRFISRQTSRQMSIHSNHSNPFGSADEEKFLQDNLEFVQSKLTVNKEQVLKPADDDDEDDDQYIEKRFKGSNSFKLYIMYLTSGFGFIGFLLFFFFFVVSQFLLTYTDYSLANW